MPPQLRCREVFPFASENLAAVTAAFASADAASMRQAWLRQPDADFTPATVRTGWRPNALLVFAELEDADIFTDATAPNQRMWELGDVLEIFLSPEDAAHYVEFHVTPNNLRFQLAVPNVAALCRAQADGKLGQLLLPDGAFQSRAWVHAAKKKWFVFAEIPVSVVCGSETPLPGMRWKFSFSRYEYARGRKKPICSSTSPHARLDYHRREEWGTLIFL
ncbi:MAG: hypothetical protein ACRED1_02325 [Limisphaerales bacterium]